MKKAFVIPLVSLITFFTFTSTGFSQDSTRRPAREIIDSTSEKTDRLTGRNQKKLLLEKNTVQAKDSVCSKKKGKHSKRMKPGKN